MADKKYRFRCENNAGIPGGHQWTVIVSDEVLIDKRPSCVEHHCYNYGVLQNSEEENARRSS